MPETTTQLIPHIACRNALDAIAFYEKAFSAQTLSMIPMPDGRVLHAALSINGAALYISEEFPEHGGHSPQSLGGTPITLHLHVADCDAVYNQAVAAGCTVAMPMDDMFWGDRYGTVLDPYGHRWSIATTIRKPTQEDIQKGMASFPTPEA